METLIIVGKSKRDLQFLKRVAEGLGLEVETKKTPKNKVTRSQIMNLSKEINKKMTQKHLKDFLK